MTRLFLPFAVGIGRYSKRFVEPEELLRRRFQDPAQSPQLPDRDVLEAGLDLCIGTPRQVTAFDLQPGRNLLLGQAASIRHRRILCPTEASRLIFWSKQCTAFPI